MTGVNVTYEDAPLDVVVRCNWAAVSWADIEEFQAAYRDATPTEQQALVNGIVGRVIGQPVGELPALVVVQVATYVVERLTGAGAAGKN